MPGRRERAPLVSSFYVTVADLSNDGAAPMFTSVRQVFSSSLSRGAAVTFGIRVAGTGLLYALHVCLARWMGADGYGVYVFAISWTSVLAQLGALGLPTAALRFVSTYRTEQQASDLWSFVRTGRVLVAGGAGGLALMATGGALLFPAGAFSFWALLTGFWIAPLLALLSFETELLRASNRFALSYAPKYLLRPLGIGGGTGAILWATDAVSPTAVLLCTGGVFGGVLLIQQWGVRWALPSARGALFPPRTRQWIGVALPLLLTNGFDLVLQKTDVVLLGVLAGPDDVGIYFAAMRTAQVVTFFGFAVDAVAAPHIAQLYHNGDDRLQAAASRFAHWYFWPTLATAGGLVLFATPILSLFGGEFLAGTPVMYAFLAGLLVNAATGPQTHLLSLTGHERSCASIFGWCALLNVVLNLGGIYALGTLGAALATATTIAVRNLWVHSHVIRQTGIRPSIIAALRSSSRSPA